MKISDLLNLFEITPKLIYYINNLHRRMLMQVRFSLGKLNGITTVEVNKLFNLTGLEPSNFEDVFSQFPKNAHTIRQPIYLLLTLIMIKAYKENNVRFALDVNTLLGLVILGRRKYRYIRFVDQNILDQTINNITKKTYVGLHGVVWMVNEITTTCHNKYIQRILNNVNDLYSIYRYIIDMFNRFNQIMKTIAKNYYYNIIHKNDVKREVIIKNRTTDIMNYFIDKTLPQNILDYIANVSKTSIDKINQLYHHIQIYNSMQSQMQVIIYNILDRLLAYLEIYKSQFDKPLDINDPIWINTFMNKLKRSTIILKAVDSDIFKSYGYDRFEILYFTFIVTLYIDSMNHNSDYYGSNATNDDDNFSKNYDQYINYDANNEVDYYTENMEALFDGVIINEELIDWYWR